MATYDLTYGLFMSGGSVPTPPTLCLGISVSFKTIHAPPPYNQPGFTYMTLDIPASAAIYIVKPEYVNDVLTLLSGCNGHVPVTKLHQWAKGISLNSVRVSFLFRPGVQIMLMLSDSNKYATTNSPGTVIRIENSVIAGFVPSWSIQIETSDLRIYDRLDALFYEGNDNEVHAP